jgi:hypothetical protein
MTNGNTYTRRTVLGLGAVAFAGAGVATLAPRVAATQVFVDSYTAESKAFTTDNGRLAHLTLHTDYVFSWNGFDSGAKSATVRLYATVDGDEKLVASADVDGLDGYAGGPKDGTLPDADLVYHFGAEAFEDQTEGDGPTDVDVDLRLEVEVHTYAGSHTGDKSSTMTVSVTNETATVSVGAESTVEGAGEEAPDVYENDGLTLSIRGQTATLELPTGAFTDDDSKPNHAEIFFGDASGNWTGQIRYATADSAAPTMEGISYQLEGESWMSGTPHRYTAHQKGDSLRVTFPTSVESIGAVYTEVDGDAQSSTVYLSSADGLKPWHTGGLIPL